MGAIRISEERGVRYLHFGSRWIQGAMRIGRPFALELEYTREMMLPLLLRDSHGWPEHALLVGLGAGSLAKFLYRHRPACRLTIVELRQDVVDTAYAFFKLPDDPARITLEVADGVAFIAQVRGRYDLVLVDGFDARGRAGALDSTPFYAHCRRRLRAGGLLCTNLLSRTRGTGPSVDRLREAFGGRAIALPRSEAGNTIAIAATGEPVEMEPRVLSRRAEALAGSTGLKLARTLARMAQQPELANAW